MTSAVELFHFIVGNSATLFRSLNAFFNPLRIEQVHDVFSSDLFSNREINSIAHGNPSILFRLEYSTKVATVYAWRLWHPNLHVVEDVVVQPRTNIPSDSYV